MTARAHRTRLAIITTHPIQYYAPWFRWIAADSGIGLRVFYLWNFGVTEKTDPDFGQRIAWDIPLLDGYDWEFVPNTSDAPGSNRFFGIRNPQLRKRIAAFGPDAALLIGYRYASMMRLILTPRRARGYPLLFRGDSHRLSDVRNSTGEARNLPLKERIRRRAIETIYKKFAAFLYVGQANREYFRLHGVAEEKLFFAPHAVDNERFMRDAEGLRLGGLRWREEVGVPRNHLLVMFAGKLEPKKRPLDLLEAVRRLARSDVSLVFVGAGALEQELHAQAARAPNVFFAPFQNQTEMPRTYAACDLFVLPSFGPEESWGLAINEALCLGRPVIVSSHVGCGPDLVKPHVNGLIFPAGDVAALAAALGDALADPARLAVWGEKGREIISQYSYKHATHGLKKAVASVVADVDRRNEK